MGTTGNILGGNISSKNTVVKDPRLARWSWFVYKENRVDVYYSCYNVYIVKLVNSEDTINTTVVERVTVSQPEKKSHV